MGTVVQGEQSRVLLGVGAFIGKLFAEMLASLLQCLKTCTRQGLCIGGVCAAKDNTACPFLNSFNLLRIPVQNFLKNPPGVG